MRAVPRWAQPKAGFAATSDLERMGSRPVPVFTRRNSETSGGASVGAMPRRAVLLVAHAVDDLRHVLDVGGLRSE